MSEDKRGQGSSETVTPAGGAGGGGPRRPPRPAGTPPLAASRVATEPAPRPAEPKPTKPKAAKTKPAKAKSSRGAGAPAATPVSALTEVPPVSPRTAVAVGPVAAPAVPGTVTPPVTTPPPTAVPAERPAAAPGGGRRVRRGRRVKRIVRRIDLWSVLKLSIVVYSCIYAATMATLTVLWGILHSSGTMEKVTDFLADVGMDDFRFYGEKMFYAAAAIGAVGVLTATVITVLATALVNIISEMTGGIRLVVIEEES